jgi:hypothetical protein
MSKLNEKSKFNIAAAELLIEKDLYAPSIHCSYYSCLQKIKSTFPSFFGITYNQIDINIASGNKNEHTYLISFIEEQIFSNVGDFEFRNFHNNIKDLKQFRVESDYKNIEVTSDQSKKALNKAVEINKLLSNIFHV